MESADPERTRGQRGVGQQGTTCLQLVVDNGSLIIYYKVYALGLGPRGWVPQGDDFLGTWDKVTFTANQADWTVELVNGLSHYQLDHDFGLDRRAADSIVAALPIQTVSELAGLYYVGKTALTALKEGAIVSAEQANSAQQAPAPPAVVAIRNVRASIEIEIKCRCVAAGRFAVRDGKAIRHKIGPRAVITLNARVRMCTRGVEMV